MMMVDWGAGSYETSAGIELAPAAETVVEAARIEPGEDVIDLACGTGNAALLAAGAGARVVGIDGAARLLEVAAERAHADGVALDLRRGDLLALPAPDASADVVVSVFGVIFAADAAAALGEISRVLRPGGRVLLSAWVPEGPIDEMLVAIGRIAARATGAPPQPRFAWSDPSALGPVAAAGGLELHATTTHRLPIEAISPEAYIERNRAHPMALAGEQLARKAGIADEIYEAQLAVLRGANEVSDGFRVHSPYAVHSLVAADA
jgi:SAM-dependent methyltransferase